MDVISTWFQNINLQTLLGGLNPAALARAITLVIAGWFLARLARLTIMRVFSTNLTPQQKLLFRRGVSYSIFILFLVSAFRELGFDFGVLLGAAGILTVAIGFASQTSISNLISGLFLVFERAIEIDDVIKVNNHTGIVQSIDLLSTKIRTFDNLLVRIPNETMIKTDIVNYNRFPIRRIDTQIGIAYEQDLKHVQDTLQRIAQNNPLSLDEPAPVIVAQGFGESSINFQFSVWGTTENYLALRNSIQKDIKEIFEQEGISIPYPHRIFIEKPSIESSNELSSSTPQTKLI